MSVPKPVNIGIVAHIDAGKTSLTERLLFDNGVIDSLGSVDAGTTQTDSNEIERRRGITIRTAVASFLTGGLQVNLIDTPGHSEFVAEVERALSVLDGAILVISAVEGVQAHTRVLMKTLHGMRMPTLLFVNKIDRMGARDDDLLAEIANRLSVGIVPMNAVRDIGTRHVRSSAPPTDAFLAAAETLADSDDGLLADLVAGQTPDRSVLTKKLAAQTAAGLVHPVFFGSARTGAGVADLLAGIRDLLPQATGDPDGSPSGVVFALEAAHGGGRTAYVRLFRGRVRARQRLGLCRREADGTVTEYSGQLSGLEVVGAPPGADLTPGNIARIRGLPGIRVGDRIGSPGELTDRRRLFARPSLETLVRARQPEQTTRLHTALVALAEQDPLISTRAVAGGQTSVLLYGEIQKEILAETLARDFGVDAVFEASRTLHLERPVGAGSAVVPMGRSPFVAGVGLRVEPAPTGTGIVYGRETEYGALPHAFHLAIEQTVRDSLGQGLYGWPVTDCAVTLTFSEFDNACSTGGDFRLLTPVVLMRALHGAGTRVYEPCHAFEVEVPPDTLNAVTTQLLGLEAKIAEVLPKPEAWLVTGEIPARQAPRFTRQLPKLTRGEGVWWFRPQGDRAVQGTAPERERTDGNPLNAKEYLHHLAVRAR